MTVREVAAVLGVDGSTVRRRLERGEWEGVQVTPRLWLIPVTAVERAKGEGKRKRGPKPGVRRQSGSGQHMDSEQRGG